MWAAANKKGGVGGVSQAVGKEFAGADKGGKLPAKKGGAKADKRSHRQKTLYDRQRR
jgi:hypothetical protein